ncbi:MAG: hypothetical protein O3B78_03030 [Bacteroidetes bacterium]|nr:hypothetical protein [Bacteroidota bacterium]
MKKIVLIAIMGLGFSVVAQAQTEAPAEVVAIPAVEQVPTKKCCKGGDTAAACQGQGQAEGTAAAPKKSCCQSGDAAAGSCQGHAHADASAESSPATDDAVETAAPTAPACQGSSEVKPCCKKKHD